MDPYRLQRFVDAQADAYERALAELKNGRKASHWMWFVFPQLAGLGRSPTAQFYGIGSIEEARAYLAHPVLGPRLVFCTEAVNGLCGRTAHQILGSPDDVKFHSSMTLFAAVSPSRSIFTKALRKYFCGAADAATLSLLSRESLNAERPITKG